MSERAKRSHMATPDGLKKADTAIRKFTSKKVFADLVGVSRATVQKFFAGKAIGLDNFQAICRELGLNWQEISGLENSASLLEVKNFSDSDCDVLVQNVRRLIATDIQERCGTMRVLDMRQPVGLSDIYTDVNILETITGRRRLGINELMKSFDPELDSFDRRGLGRIFEERVPGLKVVERYPKLMVLGKPGAGKTTFLKYLAIQSIWGKFQANRVPIFITLKDFSEDENNRQQDLLKFIFQLFENYEVTPTQVTEILKNGRALILLDGLDEVREEDSKRILNQIQKLSNQFFFSKEFENDRQVYFDERKKKLDELKAEEQRLKNWEISLEKLRTLLQDKTANLKEEYKDFNSSQRNRSLEYRERKLELDEEEKSIKSETFKLNLEKRDFTSANLRFDEDFPDLYKHTDQGLEFLAKKFPNKLYSNHFVITCRIAAREYTFEKFREVEVADFDDQQIQIFATNWFGKDLVRRKRFIQRLLDNQPVRELASNPLLLTLLCLVFEESGDFPSNRSLLYKEGVAILLKKWDAQRNIERDQVYKNLSSPRKEDLLSHIAWITFERKDYFFKQGDVEVYIAEYIRNLVNARTDPEALRLDSEVVLKSIEAQHGLLVERARGIYSFSHLTFQEYFTARRIVATSDPLVLEKSLQAFVNHLTERRWMEVFLLSVGILQSADHLLRLMKNQVDLLIQEDTKLQDLLSLINKKAVLTNLPYKQVATRAFFFAIISDQSLAVSIARARSNSQYRETLQNLLNSLLLTHGCALELCIKPAGNEINFSNVCDRGLQLVDKLDSAIKFFNSLTHELVHCLDNRFQDFRTTNLNLLHSLVPNLDINQMLICIDIHILQILKKLRKQLPDPRSNLKGFQQWWANNGHDWINEFSLVTAKCKNLGQELELNEEQRKTLRIYCDANKLIVDCLNSDCYVSLETRQEIEDTLLLPK